MYNPDSLTPYKTMPEWTAKTLPKGFQKKHNTKVGTWAKLSIVSGQLKYFALDNAGEITDTYVFDKDSEMPFIEPQVWHKVAPLTDDLRCQLTFYCRAKDFYQKKYKLSATHSEVIEAVQIMYKDGLQFNGLTALDLGCGSGRNALFLQANGFSVNAYDKNSASIDKLNEIIEQENLDCLYATTVDLHQLDELANEFALTQYHLVVSTVVLMFLDKEKVASVIDAMQQHTKTGGYNVIVCAMDSQDYPLSRYQGLLPFDFGLKTGELLAHYQGWQIKKYNEDVGHLHRLDDEGNPIALRFATMIARKQ